MRQELVELLKKYLLSEATLHDCYEWLVGVDWNDPWYRADTTLARDVGTLELLAIEALEGLRDESDFREEAGRIAQSTSARFVWSEAGFPDVSALSAPNDEYYPSFANIVATELADEQHIVNYPSAIPTARGWSFVAPSRMILIVGDCSGDDHVYSFGDRPRFGWRSIAATGAESLVVH